MTSMLYLWAPRRFEGFGRQGVLVRFLLVQKYLYKKVLAAIIYKDHITITYRNYKCK
jgi:hypothetical protein